jgi:asparagine synthase (glutamine-hydrolysing)
MSGIAGIFNLDGRPVQPSQLQAMISAMPHRGPDGCSTRVVGRTGLGFAAMHTTPESTKETQPWGDESGEIWVVFDGRLDNRDDLTSATHDHGLHLRNESDIELVLRTYQIAGQDVADRLLGDFALLIWDAQGRRLIGARDIVAERPFFYAMVGQTLFVASEIRALLTQPEIPTDPNLWMVAEHLADRIVTNDETLFRSIRKLPPAHRLSASGDGLEVKRYWAIDPAREIRYRREEGYAAHFREIFEKAVRCRLRSNGPVAADLSGGLDSSSVAGMIEDCRRRGVEAYSGVEYMSMIFPDLPCDEDRWIRSIEEKLNFRSHRVTASPLDTPQCRQQVRFHRDLPDYPNGMMADRLRSAARERGCRVRLTGLGGDEWLAGSARHTTDHIRRMQLVRLVRQLASDAELLDISWKRLLRRSISALVPGPVRSAINSADIAGLIDNGFAIHRAEMQDRAAATSGLVLREPFNDRRLIEFALAIPEDQRWNARGRKITLRRAMADMLPEEILQRNDKAEFSSVFVDAIRTADPELFRVPMCSQIGWVDAGQVEEMYRRFTENSDRRVGFLHPNLWVLWKIVGMEIWCQTLYNEGTGAPVA